MHTTLFMAMSVNGFIARENGEEDFISNAHWADYVRFCHEYGNVIIGRKTYEAIKSWNEEIGFQDIAGVTKIILSSDVNMEVGPEFVVLPSPDEAMHFLAESGFDHAFVCGGSMVNTAFLKTRLVNEIILNIEPVLVGEGKRVFAEDNFLEKLKFISKQERENGIVTLTYKTNAEPFVHHHH
ncbi:MAG: dihydrofolate reductase [Candidatus Uhrbacteria bacterium]|nr:dihydrofolate reductase [Candidatus Uhrbacteria bacterium]